MNNSNTAQRLHRAESAKLDRAKNLDEWRAIVSDGIRASSELCSDGCGAEASERSLTETASEGTLDGSFA